MRKKSSSIYHVYAIVIIIMAERQIWSSRTTFILASVGSAIGLGNLWRFPYVVYTNGGGAFLIPYLIALLTIGIPLLLLEMGIGYRTRSGAPRAFSRLLGRKYNLFGWIMVLVAFLVVTYYGVIVAWCVDYTVFSLNLSWGSDPSAFFYDSFLNISDAVDGIGSINIVVLGGAIVGWLWIYTSVFRGVKSLEKMLWITVVLPWILIIVFVIRGITLPGAMDGLAFYLTPDFQALLNPDVWVAAYGQIFYSLSLAFGIIIAYSRLIGEKQDLVKNGVIIALANCFTSIFAGLAVFSTLGYLAHNSGVEVTEVVRGGIELVFITYPSVINALPIMPELFGVLFFLMLVNLGISSSFSIVESLNAGILDYVKKPEWLVTGVICIAAFIVGIIYMTNGGLYMIDLVDHYLMAYILPFIGLLEVVFIGSLYGAPKMRTFINRYSDLHLGRWWDYCIRFVVPVFLIFALCLNFYEGIFQPYGGYEMLDNIIVYLLIGVIFILAIFMSRLIRNSDDDDYDDDVDSDLPGDTDLEF